MLQDDFAWPDTIAVRTKQALVVVRNFAPIIGQNIALRFHVTLRKDSCDVLLVSITSEQAR